MTPQPTKPKRPTRIDAIGPLERIESRCRCSGIVRGLTMTTILRSDDISCPSCVAGLEKTLSTIEGVEYAKAWFSSGRIEIRHDPAHVSVSSLVHAVRIAGYHARPSVM